MATPPSTTRETFLVLAASNAGEVIGIKNFMRGLAGCVRIRRMVCGESSLQVFDLYIYTVS